MFRYLEGKYKDIIIILLILIVLIGVTTSHRLNDKLRWYDKAVLFITTPMQYALNGLIKGSVDFSNKYVLFYNIRKDNLFLIEQNRLLKKELNDLRETGFENKRLRRLLLFKEKISYFMLPAEVFARDASLEFKTVRINKGLSSGVKKGMAVVNYEGVVGQIIRVASGYSDVLIVTDPNSAIDAMIQRSRARGIIQGKSTDNAIMKYLNRLDDAQVEDIIVSSGFAGRFPKGLMIGKVTKVDKKKFGVTQFVEIKPSVLFNKLEEVFVILEGK